MTVEKIYKIICGELVKAETALELCKDNADIIPNETLRENIELVDALKIVAAELGKKINKAPAELLPYMLVGNRLAAVRKSKGMTRHELETRSGVSIGIIRAVEDNEVLPSIKIALLFAAALEVSFEDLFYLYYPVMDEFDLSLDSVKLKSELWNIRKRAIMNMEKFSDGNE